MPLQSFVIITLTKVADFQNSYTALSIKFAIKALMLKFYHIPTPRKRIIPLHCETFMLKFYDFPITAVIKSISLLTTEHTRVHFARLSPNSPDWNQSMDYKIWEKCSSSGLVEYDLS